MLVLCRDVSEGITITPPSGEPIHVRIISVRGDKVRLGIEADKSVRVHRDEIEARIRNQEGGFTDGRSKD